MSISERFGAANHILLDAARPACLRRNAIKPISLLLIAVTSLGLAESAVADNWIDAKTGQRVADFPVVTDPNGPAGRKTDWIHPDAGDPSRAFDPRTGRNFFRDPADCHWKDAKTGQRVADFPVITDPNGPAGRKTDWIHPDAGDSSRAFDPRTGRNFVRVDCPPPTTSTTPQPSPSPPEAPTPPPPPSPETPGHASIPAWQLGLGYAYLHTDGEEVKNLNGVSVSAFYNINSWIGIGGEYSRLYGSTTVSFGLSDADVSLHRDLWLLGPQFNFHPSDTVSISVDTLIGRVRDNNKFSFGGFSDSSSASAMAYKIGVGGELRINDSWSVGVDANWTPTHFGGQWQHNYGVGAKVIWNFGQR